MNKLNPEVDTHLWYGSFSELVLEQVTGVKTNILCLFPSGDINDELVSHLRSKLTNPETQLEVYSGDQSNLPFNANAFDITVHINPKQAFLDRHNPFYEAERVTESGGSVVFKAPNYLAHSKFVNFDTIYAVGWEDPEETYVAAVGAITEKGDLEQFTGSLPDYSEKPSIVESTNRDRSSPQKTSQSTLFERNL